MITEATVDSDSAVITATLNSRAEESFTVDFFANDACDPSGHGEGQRFLGGERVTTDAEGNVGFTATFTGTTVSLISGGDLVTATATDLEGNTAEFSQCVEAADASPAPLEEKLFLPLLRR